MKKTIFILIVALLISGSVFAQTGAGGDSTGTPPSDDLTVKLTVTEKNTVEWFTESVTADTWETAISTGEESFDSETDTIVVYPSVLTNKAGQITIYVKGEPLSKEGGYPDIELRAVGDGAVSSYNDVTWDGSNSDTSYIQFTESELEEGAVYKKRAYSPKLTLSLPEGYGDAPAVTGYEATLTLTTLLAEI